MRILVICIFLAATFFSFFLKFLNYKNRNAPLPENVKDIFDAEAYKKNLAYSMANTKFSIVSGIIGMLFTLVLLLFNIHFQIFDFLNEHTANIYLLSLGMLLIPIFVESVIDAIVGIYDTFVIEEKYGFNKTTPGTYILDFIKGLLISFALIGGLLSLFILLHSRLGDIVYPVFFFILIGFMLLLSFLSPFLIRIFEKLTPLEEGELKDKINALATKHNFRVKGIFRVDASKRSTKLNAFATGFGKTKTIGLYDTLIEKMTEDEIIGVLAHEIGHAKHKHILKRIPLSIISLIVGLVGAYFIITNPAVSQAFGFEYENLAFGIFILTILITPISLVLRIPSSALSRKHEFEADTMEAETVGSEVDITAIKKLYREDLGNLTPHPFVVKMTYSHPTATQRIAHFERLNIKKAD